MRAFLPIEAHSLPHTGLRRELIDKLHYLLCLLGRELTPDCWASAHAGDGDGCAYPVDLITPLALSPVHAKAQDHPQQKELPRQPSSFPHRPLDDDGRIINKHLQPELMGGQS